MGVTISDLNSFLLPLTLLLLAYSLHCVYRVHKTVKYWPFGLASLGTILIIADNFVFGFPYSVGSWAGNVLLIGSTWKASRDEIEEKQAEGDESLFDF